MPRRYRWGVTHRLRLLVLLAGVVAIAGCGSSSSNTSGTTQTTAATVKGHPAGALPSESARMVCAAEAQNDIAASLGVKATVTKPTWVNHVYSCNYTYAGGGVITLSVHELDSKAQTDAEYAADGKRLGRRPDVISFGEGAFLTTNGSVVARKDFKVLEVDVSKLPDKFGSPPQDRSNVALSVTATVMSCWTGA